MMWMETTYHVYTSTLENLVSKFNFVSVINTGSCCLGKLPFVLRNTFYTFSVLYGIKLLSNVHARGWGGEVGVGFYKVHVHWNC